MKVTISLDDDLMARIDRYADDNYMTRSGFISLSCTQYLNQNDVISSIKSIELAMRKIADTGQLDEDSIKDLEDFTRLINMTIGQ